MKIIVDQTKCVGAGQCLSNAPKVFNQSDETGLVVVLNYNPDESQRAVVEAAVDACPTGAISIGK